MWKHDDQQICRIRRKFFSLCALIFYFDLWFCKNILNFSPGQNKFFGVLIINSEVHYDLCQDILIICDFSSINLSMEHIERSHLTNRLPNFHRSLTLYHDFFLHERCGAKIIEHPLAEWSVEWPIFCLDRWPDQKIKNKNGVFKKGKTLNIQMAM